MVPGSQNSLISEHLESGKPITPIEALELYGSFRLSGRIFELRRLGMSIKQRMIETSTGKHVAQYYM